MGGFQTVINRNMANPFLQIRPNSDSGRKSFNWYMNQVRQIMRGVSTPSSAIANDIGKPVSQFDIGSMYLFRYDAKWKDKLPYFDAFPLCLPFEPTKDGFWGLNLHYLPYMMRAQLLGKLIETTNDRAIDDKTTMRYNWELLSNSAQFPEVKPCVKRYLTKQIRSRFFEINPQDWKGAIFLPVEDFNVSKNTVFQNSRRAI